MRHEHSYISILLKLLQIDLCYERYAMVDFHLQNLSVPCCQNGRVSCNALGLTREVVSE